MDHGQRSRKIGKQHRTPAECGFSASVELDPVAVYAAQGSAQFGAHQESPYIGIGNISSPGRKVDSTLPSQKPRFFQNCASRCTSTNAGAS